MTQITLSWVRNGSFRVLCREPPLRDLGADAATKKRDHEQGGLGHAPAAGFGAMLVQRK